MRRIAGLMVTVLLVALVAGYAAELLAGESEYEDSCPVCRAVRISGRHYGLKYEHTEECALTKWYREHVDPLHGLDPQHPHLWQRSACTVVNRRGWGVVDYDCAADAPIFTLHPDIELTALLQIPDRETQIALIQSLDSPDRNADVERAKLLIEYHDVLSDHVTWHDWWEQHAYQFGLGAPPPPKPAADKKAPAESDPFLRHTPLESPSSVLPH